MGNEASTPITFSPTCQPRMWLCQVRAGSLVQVQLIVGNPCVPQRKGTCTLIDCLTVTPVMGTE